MREIKFREAIFAEPDNRFIGFHYWGWIDGEWVEPESTDPEASKQYTGLKDKNGVEIYEGDLFYWSKYSTSPAEVYWDDRWSGWRGRVNGEMQFDKTYDISPIKYGEVIGNIYENPELLNKKP